MGASDKFCPSIHEISPLFQQIRPVVRTSTLPLMVCSMNTRQSHVSLARYTRPGTNND